MKVKNKQTGEIVEFIYIPEEQECEYVTSNINTTNNINEIGVFSERQFNELYEVIPQTDLGVNDDTSKKDDILEDPNHPYGGMTTNWIEQFKELFYKKVSNVDSERDIILDFITTLLEKQREEYIEMIIGIEIKGSRDYELAQLRYREKIINLIK